MRVTPVSSGRPGVRPPERLYRCRSEEDVKATGQGEDARAARGGGSRCPVAPLRRTRERLPYRLFDELLDGTVVLGALDDDPAAERPRHADGERHHIRVVEGPRMPTSGHGVQPATATTRSATAPRRTDGQS